MCNRDDAMRSSKRAMGKIEAKAPNGAAEIQGVDYTLSLYSLAHRIRFRYSFYFHFSVFA